MSPVEKNCAWHNTAQDVTFNQHEPPAWHRITSISSCAPNTMYALTGGRFTYTCIEACFWSFRGHLKAADLTWFTRRTMRAAGQCTTLHLACSTIRCRSILVCSKHFLSPRPYRFWISKFVSVFACCSTYIKKQSLDQYNHCHNQVFP